MAKTVTGIDIGSRTAVALKGSIKGNSFAVSGFALVPTTSSRGAEGWSGLQEVLKAGFKPGLTRVGLSGPDLNIRYTRVPRVPDWQLRKLMSFEVDEVGGTSGSEVASDFNVLPELPEIEGEDVVLLAMAKESMLEDHEKGLRACGGNLDSCTPNAIGLYNAWLRFGVLLDDTVLVANIGHENIDVIIARGHDLLFARSLGGGSKLFDEAIAARLSLSLSKSEQVKIRHVDLDPGAKYPDASVEKASMACKGPAGQLLGLLSSSVMFCKSQVKLTGLELDRVIICGGGSALKGLDRYLSQGMNVPVERFDAFQVVDISALDAATASLLEDHRDEAVIALGLATAASDPAAYSVEIVPRALQKKRDFMNGTMFLIASAVLAVIYLGWFGMQLGTQRDALDKNARLASTRYKSAERANTETAKLVAENERMAIEASALFALVGSGEQIGRTAAILHENLHKDFWVTNMIADVGADDELGISRDKQRPILMVKGRTRQGTGRVNERFDLLVASIEAGLDGLQMKSRLGDGGAVFEIELSTLIPGSEGLATAAEEDSDEELVEDAE
jgi:type IV pilus assembly protein PilM